MRRRNSPRAERPLDEGSAREKCLRLLSVRARSAAELRDRLVKAGFERSVFEPVLADLAAAGLLDDEEFARSWISARKSAGIGRRRLAVELGRKGIARSMIERLLDEQVDDDTERRQAEALARKRLGAEWDAKALGRLRRLLLSRGYGFAIVDDVLRTIAGERIELES